MLSISLPISKSIANRMQIRLAFLGEFFELSEDCCDDIRVMREAIEKFFNIELGTPVTIDVGNSGTAMRFLTAYYATQPGKHVTLTGCVIIIIFIESDCKSTMLCVT